MGGRLLLHGRLRPGPQPQGPGEYEAHNLSLNHLPNVQGDNSEWLQPPVDLVPTVLAASGPLLELPTAQAG